MNPDELDKLKRSFDGCAGRLIRRGLRDIPDILYLRDFGFDWNLRRSELIEAIEVGKYVPQSIEVVDLPKDELCVRPLTRLAPVDQVFFEACITAMQPYLDQALASSVFSSRWSRQRDELKNPVDCWLRMQATARDFHKRNPRLFMAKTDVSSFYENVDIDILGEDLKRIVPLPGLVDLLLRKLDLLVKKNGVWGLPQGCDGSGMLANVYLLAIDQQIGTSGLKYLRYSDDMLIFGDSFEELRTVLIQVTRRMRDRKLHLSTHKTRVVEPGLILEEFEDLRKSAINYGLAVGDASSYGDLRDLFQQASSSNMPDSRDTRFALTRLGKLKDDIAVDWSIGNLERLPHLSGYIVTYLLRLAARRDDIIPRIFEIVSSGKLHRDSYSEMQALRLLVRSRVDSPSNSSPIWSILEDRNRENFVREYAIRHAGARASIGSAERLKRLFSRETDWRVRRAALVAIYENRAADSDWFAERKGENRELDSTIDFLLSKPRLRR